MKTIESILEPITGYLKSIIRNTENGWYEIEVGIYTSWVFDDNNEISCTIISESPNGKLIKIAPKNNDISIDDLIDFVILIIETNKKITDRELEFAEKMEKIKSELEIDALKFYNELEELKKNSFKKINENFIFDLNNTNKENITIPKKRKIPKNDDVDNMNKIKTDDNIKNTDE